jgi:radical SAM protein with 4Fe4S-binding SPASM domain
MCPVSFDDWERTVGGITRLPAEAIERLYADLATMAPGRRLKVIRLYGEGEPMLDKDLARSVRLAHEMRITDRTEVTSNGSALTEGMGRSLIESGLTYLRVSIYGVAENRQRHITQTGVSAERIHENIVRFRELRDRMGSSSPFLYVKMIDTGEPDEVRLLHARYDGVADEVEPLMDWDSYAGRDLLQVAPRGFAPTPRRGKQVCPYPFYSLVIKANGDVVACCVDWNKGTAVGNILEEPFSSIWRGDRLREFRRMHLGRRRYENASCANCWYLETVPDNLDGVAPEDLDRTLG